MLSLGVNRIGRSDLPFEAAFSSAEAASSLSSIRSPFDRWSLGEEVHVALRIAQRHLPLATADNKRRMFARDAVIHAEGLIAGDVPMVVPAKENQEEAQAMGRRH